MRFDPRVPLEQALQTFHAANGLTAEAPERFIRIQLGVLSVPFPNTEARRRVLRRHDLHHVATGYDTDFRGEAEIAGFELAAGCGRSFPAWFYDLGAFALGLLRWPRRCLRAFLRGRAARSLLVNPELANVATVGALRGALALDRPARMAMKDVLALAGVLALLAGYLVAWPFAVGVMTISALRSPPRAREPTTR